MSRLLLSIAKQWVAGEDKHDAIEAAKEANRRGIVGLINLLGEHLKDEDKVKETVNEYLEILRIIEEEKIRGYLSVKPTQLGLDISKEICYRNTVRLAEAAHTSKSFLWIDMEGSSYTQPTLDLYYSMLDSFKDVGVAIQAYLYRSKGDLQNLLDKGGIVRLCKGAYNESRHVAIKSRSEITSNFSKLTKILFEEGEEFAVATHDDKLLNEAVRLSQSFPKDFEFQMLRGIRDALKSKLARDGFRVCEYIPYGPMWLSYFLRRIRERKRNLLLIVRSMLSR